MKKTFYTFAILVSVAVMSSCSNKTTSTEESTANTDESGLFVGMLPAADAAGIRYSLKLDYGQTNDSAAGTYDLEQVYIVNDSSTPDSIKDGISYKANGDFFVLEQAGKKYVKLTSQSTTDSIGMPMYFLVDSDSTITLVNSDLQVSTTEGLNYTLTRQK